MALGTNTEQVTDAKRTLALSQQHWLSHRQRTTATYLHCTGSDVLDERTDAALNHRRRELSAIYSTGARQATAERQI